LLRPLFQALLSIGVELVSLVVHHLGLLPSHLSLDKSLLFGLPGFVVHLLFMVVLKLSIPHIGLVVFFPLRLMEVGHLGLPKRCELLLAGQLLFAFLPLALNLHFPGLIDLAFELDFSTFLAFKGSSCFRVRLIYLLL
jgi:hypothetical protein